MTQVAKDGQLGSPSDSQMSDEVVIVSTGVPLGESTLAELEYARHLNKPIRMGIFDAIAGWLGG